VPTWLVKEIRELLAPFITLLFNRLLVTGCFPSEFKHAIVHPLLKKNGLDVSDLKNYRPVSNLSFLSKLLEKVVQRRLQAFLDSNQLMPSQQSAYRQHHSTETAVLKVYNDLLMAADSGLVSALCLLDLTAAFDTVDHERQFGLRGVTLLWFRSYLSGRSYRVWFAGAASKTVHVICSTVHVICSVPQGSVLGLRLFTVYSADLVDKAVEHDINFHGYADDTQLYVHCRLEEIAASSQLLPNCWNAASQTWTISQSSPRLRRQQQTVYNEC